MDPTTTFTGFTQNTLKFFAHLKKNNNRPWFTRHKPDYLANVLHPATAFVTDMGPVLGRLFPGIVADPTSSGSIFRIYKDTRFSNDKSPYKTHLGIFFWQGPGKKLQRPGFYFELDDAGIRLYYGWYLFPPDVLKAYRETVADEDRGNELLKIKKKLEKSAIHLGGQHYKRVPAGYSIDGPRADLLRHNTLYTELDCRKPPELFSPKLVQYCLRQWKHCLPIYQWVQQLTAAPV